MSLTDQEVNKLLEAIVELDKTPRYGYSSNKRDQNNKGEFAGMGKRWLTPLELAQSHMRAIEAEKKAFDSLPTTIKIACCPGKSCGDTNLYLDHVRLEDGAHQYGYKRLSNDEWYNRETTASKLKEWCLEKGV